MPEEVAEQVIKALGKSTLRGKKVQVRRDKGAASGLAAPVRSHYPTELGPVPGVYLR